MRQKLRHAGDEDGGGAYRRLEIFLCVTETEYCDCEALVNRMTVNCSHCSFFLVRFN